MKRLAKRLLTVGLMTTMVLSPMGAFAEELSAPLEPERPVAESYQDNESIADYNNQVDEYNAAAEAYNQSVDAEYEAAVEETNKKNEEIAQHNAAEEQRVKDAEARNEQAVKDAEEKNRQIDVENEEGLKKAEQARDEQFANDQAKYNEDLEQYKADYAQYEKDLAMEQKIINAGYKSVQQYNDTINSYYNEPAKKSVEKNASAPTLGTKDTYRIKEAAVKSGRMIKVRIEHNFYDIDLSYTEEFEIDANDIITFLPLCSPAENTNPGYAAFYYNTDEAHKMGYWMESDSYVATNARYNEYGWDCGDTHEVSFKDGKNHANDIEDIEAIYNYSWMPLKTYKTYNIPKEPTAPSEPVKGEVNFEKAAYVSPELEEIAEADIWTFLPDPVKKAYMDFLTHMDLFKVPPMPVKDETPATPDAPKTETPDKGETDETPAQDTAKADPAPANVIASALATLTAPAAPAESEAAPAESAKAAETVINENAAPKAAAVTENVEVIADHAAPKAAAEGIWALINLIAAAATVLIGALMIILGLKKKENDEDEDKEADTTNRKWAVRALGVIPAIAAVVAFILTEDMTLKMVLTDKWTILMLIILAVEAVLAIASKKRTEEGEEKEADEAEEALAA